MASNYFSKQNPTDISLQSEDGGGLTLTKNGKFLFGAKLQEITDELNETSFNGVVDINPNTNSSYIGIMNMDSEPVEVNIPNNNQYSLFTPPEENIVFTDPPKDDCANEFDNSSTVLLNWENNNVNLGWDPYGANGTGIKDGEINKAKKYFKDNYWDTNSKNTGNFSIASDALNNAGNPKLLIKNLPPGLRVMAAQFNYNAKQWWTRILAAVGENWLNSGLGVPYRLTSNLGPTSSDSYEYLLDDGVTKSGKFVYNPYKVQPDPNKEFSLKGDKRIQLFIDQYDQIISVYNQDKTAFLTALKKETIRYYTALDGSNKALLNFHTQYVEKAYDLALKYINCPYDTQNSTTVKPNPSQSTQSTPPPSPTPAVSMTAQEIEEGIYAANFLPAAENETSQVFEEVLVQNPKDVIQNPPVTWSLSVISTTKAPTETVRIKANNGGKIPKDGSEFKTYGSLFKIIQPADSKGLGSQVYYPTALFNQADPLWNKLSSNGGTMGSIGCAYASFCMLVTHHKNDPGYTPQWMWDNASKSIVVYWNTLAKAVGLTAVKESGTMARIDELLKTRPVEFEWVTARANRNGWKGVKYAYGNQHWMVIVGKNTDGTYTIFDPSGGKIRSNVSGESIEVGLNNIVYIK